MDVKCMDPRQQARHQINVRNDRKGGIWDRQLMRAMRAGCKKKASSAGRSACQTLGDTGGVRRDSGGRQGPERGPEHKRRPSAPQQTGCRCRDEGAMGGLSAPSAPAPVPPWRTSARRGPDGCKAWLQGDRYQDSALQGWRTGRRIGIPTRWHQDFSWLLSAQKPGTTLVFSSPGAYLGGAPVGLSFRGCAGCYLTGYQATWLSAWGDGAAVVPLGLRVARAPKVRPRPTWDVPCRW